MKFNLKYLTIAIILCQWPTIMQSMHHPEALFELDYRNEGYGTIEDLEKILLLKIGIDPHYKVAQDVRNRIYESIVKIFVEQGKAIEIAVPSVDKTYVPGEIIAYLTHHAREHGSEIKIIVSATAKFSPTVEFTEIFSSLVGHQQTQGILYSICEPIQKGQLYFEGKKVTQYDLNRYIEWSCRK